MISRRNLLKSLAGSSLVLGVDSTVPYCLRRAAADFENSGDSILVVIQLSGGNDGLNTIIPIDDDAYRQARPELAIGKAEAIRVDDNAALHPALRDLASLMEDGLFTVVHGVGYEHPNRSHFESMDIWHTCRRKNQQRSEGWLGRFLDRNASSHGADVPALHLGGEKQPQALAAKSVPVPSVNSIEEFRFQSSGQADFQSRVEELNQLAQTDQNSSDDLLGFVHASTSAALVASRQVNQSSSEYQTNVRYPESALANKLKVVAQLIDAGLTTRVYYVELDGFDTHAAQLETHAILLRDWSQALNALVCDLEDKGHGQRVCVMTYSEFGRRVAENASGGTDHGAAAPMFFAGGGLQQPWVGVQPSLTDLQDGDLRYGIDFRQAYASVLRDWLQTNPDPILDRQFDTLPLFRRPV